MYRYTSDDVIIFY